MSKKKHDVMAQERKNFIYGIEENGVVTVDGALRRGVSKEAAEEIFDEMMDFASYAFNKAHAACYAVVAYRTALLKCLYPVEFMTALINSFLTDADKIASYIYYCRGRGIAILPPDINRSEARFSVDGGSIRFGLAAIRNVGEGVINDVLLERRRGGEFRDFSDFVRRSDGLNKRLLEGLIKAGCFDSMGVSRKFLMAHYEQELAAANAEKKRLESGQLSFFDFGAELMQPVSLTAEGDVKDEFPLDELLTMEREAIGIYASGHPLMEYEQELAEFRFTCAELTEADGSGEIRDNMNVRVGGIFSAIRTRPVKTGTGLMASGMLEDMAGSVEIVAFPSVYQKYSSLLVNDRKVIVTGRLSMREDRANSILIEDVAPLIRGGERLLVLNFTPETAVLKERVVETLRRFPGNREVYFVDLIPGRKLKAPKELSVNLSKELIAALSDLLGNKHVRTVLKKAPAENNEN